MDFMEIGIGHAGDVVANYALGRFVVEAFAVAGGDAVGVGDQELEEFAEFVDGHFAVANKIGVDVEMIHQEGV
jgi:hypothetical protein